MWGHLLADMVPPSVHVHLSSSFVSHVGSRTLSPSLSTLRADASLGAEYLVHRSCTRTV